MLRCYARVLLPLFTSLPIGAASGVDSPRAIWYPSEPLVYSRFEIRLDAEPGANPFDSRTSELLAVFTTPKGRKVHVSGFYYEPFTRVTVRGKKGGYEEDLLPAGKGSWRVRYSPTEVGRHQFDIALRREGLPDVQQTGELLAKPSPAHGFVRVEPSTRRYFEFDDRTPLFLMGECCCWGGPLGTFSYDEWFQMHRSAGMNYARLWMSPWAFGIEAEPKTGSAYRMDQAWALDYVLEQAEKNGIYLMICFDYHGMLKTRTDRWNKNAHWRSHPYNVVHGGPCKRPGDFFTHPRAKRLYKERLRYIVARWGYSTHVLAWEFWNEVDLCYPERGVTSKVVAEWHREMGAFLKRIDPNRHLVTTSFCRSGAGDEVWRLPQMDFTQSHCYNESDPATALTAIASEMYAKFGKPTFTGEYGVASGGAEATAKKDPLGAALHQALWSSALSGSAGTAMPWWWDNYIHPEGMYVVWRTLSEFFDHEPLGSPLFGPARISTSTDDNVEPKPSPGATPFTERLLPETDWDSPVAPTTIAFSAPRAEPRKKLFHAFLHGAMQPTRRRTIRLRAWFAKDACLRMHVNSVSRGARLVVSVDGQTAHAHHLRDRDRRSLVRSEYDQTLRVRIPAGLHLVTLANEGRDWLYLDWIELVNVLPASGLAPTVPVRAYGLASEEAAWVWLLNPDATWPKTPTMSVWGARATVEGLRDGDYGIEWWDPPTGTILGHESAQSRRGRLLLVAPEFKIDVAAKVSRKR